MTRDEVEELASRTLYKLFNDYKNRGLQSIYFWGSIITPDFDPSTSDVDAVGILSDEANFEELDKIREWLPGVEPKLKRLQINFFYLSELKGEDQRSRIGRLFNAEQAVFDFPFWKFVCGKKIKQSDLPVVNPRTVLKHQIELVQVRRRWVTQNLYVDMSLEYFCKSLAWLCYCINRLDHKPEPFSWKNLEAQSGDELKVLVQTMTQLKSERWDKKTIQNKLSYLFDEADHLINLYK